ncbi:hypothetical protein [Stenotrophomonas sp. GbtcB23]|nr:hypothetical protein [Stenotrophomonas sp. GbtcB23]
MEVCYYGAQGQSHSLGHTCIRVLKAGVGEIRIDSFDTAVTGPDGAYTIKVYGAAIDGRVSSMWAEDMTRRQVPHPEQP